MRSIAMRGAGWTLSSQCLRFVCQIGSIIILARILTPQDFGLVGILMSALAIVGLFRHIGLSAAIVQAETVTESQLRRLFEITLILGFLLFVIASLFGLVISIVMNDPRIAWIAPCFGVCFAFASSETIPQSLLRRRMMFRQIAAREMASAVLGTSTSITTAYFGAGYWALVYGMMVTAFTDAISSWIAARWKPSSTPAPWRDVLSFLRFGGAFTGSNLAAYFSQNLDSLLIGRIWGYEHLGYYSRARALMIQPMNQFMEPIATVLLPLFCRIQTDRTRFKTIIASLALPFLFLPAMLSTWMIIGAPEIVHILLGDAWQNTTVIFRWLAASVIYMPFGSLLYLILVASGRSKLLLHWTWTSSLVVMSGYALSVYHGTLWVAISFTLTGLLIRIPVALHFCHKSGLIATRRLAATYIFALAFAGLLLLFLYYSKLFLNKFTTNPFMVLGGTAFPIAFLLLVVITIHPSGKIFIENAKSTLRRKIKNKI
jgi:PST family polysaccharide transporter